MSEVDPEQRTLIRRKARDAANNGSNMALWRDFRATVAQLGMPMDVAISQIHREAHRWYARFCFEEGLDDEGIVAYENLVKDNKTGKWVFEPEAERYLLAVQAARGSAGVIEAFKPFEQIDADGYPSLHRVVADAEAKLGRLDAAVARMRTVTSRYDDDGHNHAALARHLLAAGQVDEAQRHVVAAAKRGVVEAPAELKQSGPSVDELRRIRDEHATPDENALLEAFVRQPGLTMLPAPQGMASPHMYGGGDMDPPDCPGCGRKILLLATIDTAAAAAQEPTLAPFVATMPRLPILHCDNCQIMFAWPSYRIAEDGRRIEIFRFASLGQGNTTFDSDKVLTPQPAQLVAPTPPTKSDPWDAAQQLDQQRWSGPQIGGAPRPINQPRRMFCPQCDAEQIFYAAVCETNAFATPVVVNPDGYMYFFACPRCRIISTVLDNT